MFRVDSSHSIGSGHVMRCITLAKSLREKGAECVFVCRLLKGNFITMISICGFRVVKLPIDGAFFENSCKDYDSWLCGSWQSDAEASIIVARKLQPNWIIVDHYALDVNWERKVRPYTKNLCVIDDLANRVHESDVLLDQNFGRTSADYMGLVPHYTVLLTGPSFMLLREEFRKLRQISLDRRLTDTGKKILVSMGGSDEYNATGAVLSALENSSLCDQLEITVILTRQSLHLDEVASQVTRSKMKVKLEVDVGNMAWYMAQNDLAIGAVGGTAWERCCLGLPTLMVVIADNQAAGANALASSGAAELVGTIKNIEKRLPELIEEVFEKNRLRAMAVVASEITDGNGTKRVRSQLIEEIL
ncbi:UDP-2,4-diacetamido-2,4,6-trideoxy-beta-L-altropyranose hydrolase [Microbulbifer discodermiae]|uniref:UDP-2,4-diacetamido-2,4, 6-trideoxy-beta-L-altropyranose hydrolase n=1 Tax=Microbulbifer sp. 2201CG32-9 TaxID=3232309 RepID=UPI00345BB5BB